MGLESDLTLQKYRILADENGKPLILGQGAMGTAYMAIDPVLDRKVVLKLIKQELVSDDTIRKRFLREAKAAASLQHPNVAGVFEFCEEDDMIFYAMELIEGRNLAQVVGEDGPLAPEDALKMALEVSMALRAAESKHLIHRDIKPSNIMLQPSVTGGDPAIKLIDFGLAKALTPRAGDSLMLTKQGFVGTPVFASPEQLEEKELDIRSDIYSLGVTLWFTIRGKAPFHATTLAGMIRAHLSETPNYDDLAESGPEPVCDLLKRMLAKSPADRHANATELIEDIESCLTKIRKLPKPPVSSEAGTGTASRARGNGSAHGRTQRGSQGPKPSSVPNPPSSVAETVAATRHEAPATAKGPRFEILEVIWNDPWGPVYRGREIESGDSVVLHEVSAEFLKDPSRARELEDFIRRAGEVDHPNILYYEGVEYGAPDEPGYIVGEYWESVRIKDILDTRDHVGLQEALLLLNGVVDAADYCARNGFRDPDLDPFRILLPIPRIWAGTTTREQLTKLPIGDWPRGEVRPMIVPFSFGDVLGHALKGSTAGPVDESGRTYVQKIALLLYQLLGGSEADLRRNRYKDVPGINADVNRILKDCLTADAFRTGSDLHGALTGKHTWDPGMAPASPVVKARGGGASRSGRKPAGVIALVAVMALLAGGGVFAAFKLGWIGGNRLPQPMDDAVTVTPEVTRGNVGALNISGDVLSNDALPGRRDALTVSMINGEAAKVGVPVAGDFGEITLAANGKYTYVLAPGKPGKKLPEEGASAQETFRYAVSDGKASAEAALTITISMPEPSGPIFKQENAYAGLHLEVLPAWYCKALGIESGALVSEVMPGSPASLSKIAPGTIVTRWGGQPFGDSVLPHRDAMVKDGPGSQLELTVLESPAGGEGFKEKTVRFTVARWSRGEGADVVWDLSAADIARETPDEALRERWEAAWEKDALAVPGALAELTAVYRGAEALHPENRNLHPTLAGVTKQLEGLAAELALARSAEVSPATMKLVVPAMHGGVSAMRRLGEAYAAASPKGGEAVADRAIEWLGKAVEAGDEEAGKSLKKLEMLGSGGPASIVPDGVHDLIKTFKFEKAQELVAKEFPDPKEAREVFLKSMRVAYVESREDGDDVRAANILEGFDEALHAGGEPGADALRFLFDQYDDLEDAGGATRTLEELVSLDNPDAELLFYFAAAHEEGKLFKKNSAKALAYYEKARAAGYEPAADVLEAMERLESGGLGKTAKAGVDFLNSEGIVMRYGGKTSTGNNHFWMSRDSVTTSSQARGRMTGADKAAGKMPSGFTVNTPRGKSVKPEGLEYAYYTSVSNSKKLVLVPRWEREESLVTEMGKSPEAEELERERMLAEEKRQAEEERKKKADEERLRKREEDARRVVETPVPGEPPEKNLPPVVTGKSFTTGRGTTMEYKSKSGKGNPFWESTGGVNPGGLTIDQYCVKLTYEERIAGRLPAGHIYARSLKGGNRIVLLNASAEGISDFSNAPLAQWLAGSNNEIISPYSGERLRVDGSPWTLRTEGSRVFILPAPSASRAIASEQPSLADVQRPVVERPVVIDNTPPPPPVVVEKEEQIDHGKSFTNSRGIRMEYRSESSKGNPFWRSTGSAGASGDALHRLCTELTVRERQSGKVPRGYVYTPSSGGGGKIVLLHAAREGVPDYSDLPMGTWAPGSGRTQVISPYTKQKLSIAGQPSWSIVREGGSSFILPP